MGADYSAVPVYGLPVERFTEHVTKYNENTGQPYQVEVDAVRRVRVVGTTFEIDTGALYGSATLQLFGDAEYGRSYVGAGWRESEYNDDPTPIRSAAFATVCTATDQVLDEIGAPTEGRGWWLFLDVSI